MSMIYKSLKQVRKEELERKRRPRPISPEAVAPGYQQVLKRFAGYIILVAVFIWVTMFWLQAEVRRIVALTAAQVEEAAVEVRRAAQEQPAPEAMVPEQTVVVSEVRPLERMTPSVERRPAPPLPVAVPARIPAPISQEPVELASPNLELERHFSAQALRNNELLTIERQAAQFQGQPELAAQEIKQRLGPQSMYALRLSAYRALKAHLYP
jgi:hypothetical protein